MSEMVERVAQAITGPCLGDPEAMARAAIAAMREPTEDMLSLGGHGLLAEGLKKRGHIWRAMIAVALL
jgi:hypothetical protein